MEDFEQIQAYDSDEQKTLYMMYFRVLQGILVSLEAVDTVKKIKITLNIYEFKLSH